MMRFGKIRYKTFFLCIYIFALFFTQPILAQGIDNILKYKTLAEIQNRIAELEKEDRNNPGVIYLKAAIETDGKKAIEYYEKIVLKHPHSAYADDAKFKIGQYYFSISFYNLAYEQFQELVWQYPNSPLRDDGAYYAAQCLIAMNKVREALNALKKFQQDFPKSLLFKLAEEDIRKLEGSGQFGMNNPPGNYAGQTENFIENQSRDNNQQTVTDSGPSVATRSDSNAPGKYTVQVGAYLNLKNAENQQKYFRQKGYLAQIFTKNQNDRQLHIVCLNSFNDYLQAVKFGDGVKQKYRISFQIVNLDEF